jgi:hypothetical protein
MYATASSSSLAKGSVEASRSMSNRSTRGESGGAVLN